MVTYYHHYRLQIMVKYLFEDGKKRSENNSKGHIEEQLSDALRKRNNGTIDDFDLDGDDCHLRCLLTCDAVDQELIEKLKDLELQEIARKSKN